MSAFNSGQFVYYNPDGGADEQIGLVVRTSANDKADGSKDEYVEVIGPLDKILVREDQCRDFNAPPETNPNEVVNSEASEVTGLPKPGARKAGDK